MERGLLFCPVLTLCLAFTKIWGHFTDPFERLLFNLDMVDMVSFEMVNNSYL